MAGAAAGVVLCVDLPDAIRVETDAYRRRTLSFGAIKASVREGLERLDDMGGMLARDEYGKAPKKAGDLARRW